MSLTLHQDQSRLQLTITDDGDGFDTAMTAESGHYGLIGMRERAVLIDAMLELHSRSGRGTSVRLCKAVGKEKA
jgi:NarL family two-component system sensor histidine kinase YdfH